MSHDSTLSAELWQNDSKNLNDTPFASLKQVTVSTNYDASATTQAILNHLYEKVLFTI